MGLKETFNQKFVEAFKTREYIRRYPYEVINYKIMMTEKSGQFELPLTDEQIISIVARECKERKELLSMYSPEDDQYVLSEYLLNELSKYLPEQMTEEEVIAIVKRIKETESNMGKIIGLTVKEVGNRFDKSKIAALVKGVV